MSGHVSSRSYHVSSDQVRSSQVRSGEDQVKLGKGYVISAQVTSRSGQDIPGLVMVRLCQVGLGQGQVISRSGSRLNQGSIMSEQVSPGQGKDMTEHIKSYQLKIWSGQIRSGKIRTG